MAAGFGDDSFPMEAEDCSVDKKICNIAVVRNFPAIRTLADFSLGGHRS
jgi:hypothetical protein